MWLQLRLLETKLLDDSLALPKQADTDMGEESDSLHSGIRLLLMLKSIAHSSPVLARSEVARNLKVEKNSPDMSA